MKNFKTISFLALTLLSSACSSLDTKGSENSEGTKQESPEEKKKSEELRPYREHHFIDRHSL